MFSVSRFVLSGKLCFKNISRGNYGKINSNFIKFNFNNFGGKSKDGSDKEVNKSKKSVSGGSGASDSEARREATQQTIKVKSEKVSAKAEAASTQPQAKIEEPSQGSTVESAPSSGSPAGSAKAASVKVIQTVAGHRPPTTEDTISGRYSNTLFVVASEENNLYNVYQDMQYLLNLYNNIPSFKLFADNSGLNSTQIYSFAEELAKAGEFCGTTLKFLDLLGKNKRFMYINEIATKYIKSYVLLTKEEKITIISAQELTSSEKDQVSEALNANPENVGKTFIIDYHVDPSIIGGLRMYTENKFMDLSLASRLDKIRDEVSKLI